MHFRFAPLSVTALSLLLTATCAIAGDSTHHDSSGQIKLSDGSSFVCNDQGCFKVPSEDITLAPGQRDNISFQNDSSIQCNPEGCFFEPSRVRLSEDSTIVCNDKGCYIIPSRDITIPTNLERLNLSDKSIVSCGSDGCFTIPALAGSSLPSLTSSPQVVPAESTPTRSGPPNKSTTICSGTPPVCTTIEIPATTGTPTGRHGPGDGTDSLTICNAEHSCFVIPAAGVSTQGAEATGDNLKDEL